MITFRKRCENCIFWDSKASHNGKPLQKGLGKCTKDVEGGSELQCVCSNDNFSHFTKSKFYCADFKRK